MRLAIREREGPELASKELEKPPGLACSTVSDDTDTTVPCRGAVGLVLGLCEVLHTETADAELAVRRSCGAFVRVSSSA